MPIFNIFIGFGAVLSVLLCLVTWNRLSAYNSRYHFPESKYTKLLRIFTKEHIAIAYTFAVLFHVIITFWFLWKL